MTTFLSLIILLGGLQSPSTSKHGVEGFGGAPPLGPNDTLRQALAPYNLIKLNVLGANYNENLLDMRINACSYTHLNFDSPGSDAWNLQFHDDSARFLEALVWEDQYSPIVRLETIRRLVKGILAAYVPGTTSEYYFRHRSAGKTFLIFGDKPGTDGRMLLSMWGDEISGALKVGFRVRKNGQWIDMHQFKFSDPADGVTDAGQARNVDGSRHWNESPVTVKRNYESNDGQVDFSGRYWLSDENKPLEYSFKSDGGEGMQVVVGEPACPMPLLGDYRIPTTVRLPDRRTTFRSDTDGDRIFNNPSFNYLLLTKPSAWASPGYSTALMVAWEGRPESVEVVADKGYGEVRVSYAGREGMVWLNPTYWFDEDDMNGLFASADNYLAKGQLLQNGFPSQQLWNAIPEGLAAGAYLLTRYNDPAAPTARIQAMRTVDRLFAAEDEGKWLLRWFFAVKSAAWLVKMARELNDQALIDKYTAYTDRAMKRLCSKELGYDGRGWPGGWEHFCSARACRLAYDATGRKEYLDAYQRAADLYTIDEKGIYRDGKKLDAPGGFDTYSGSLPLGVWGNVGRLDDVNKLINLDVPNGWNDPTRPVKLTWNDAGSGPWAQDDANPEFVGFSLCGAKLPLNKKTILPTGAFPSYDATGKVAVTSKPLVVNPFFMPGKTAVIVVPGDKLKQLNKTKSQVVLPGGASEKRYLAVIAGQLQGGMRVCSGSQSLVYKVNTKGANGLGIDLRIKGDGYKVEVSPDGRQWFERINSHGKEMADQSLDASFLTGSRDELVRLPVVPLNGDERSIERVPNGESVVKSIDLPGVVECRLEMLVANAYEIACGKARLSYLDPEGGSLKAGPDSAVVRMLDASSCLKNGSRVEVRIANDRNGEKTYGGKSAYVSRITPYVVFRTKEAWIRISTSEGREDQSFALASLTIRKW